jgi:Flp pilus assembly protein TadD
LMGISSTSERLATAIFIFGKYIQLLIFPNPLSWDYSINQIPPVGWTNIYTILTLVICFGLMIYAILKTKSRDVFAFSILYFFITMSITSNIFILIGATMAERFLFLPSLGFCIALIFIINKLLKIDKSGKSKYNFNVLYIISGVILIAYLIKTIDRSKAWKDNMSLYESGVIDAPNSARAHSALANEYSMQAQAMTDPNSKTEIFNKSINEFNIGLKIYPENPEGWYNLGVVYTAMGNVKEAEKANLKVIEYNPRYARAYNNLGVIHGQRGDFKPALENFLKAIEIDTAYFDANTNAGLAYSNLRDYKKAAIYYKRGYELNPKSKSAYDNMVENDKMVARDTSSIKKTP